MTSIAGQTGWAFCPPWVVIRALIREDHKFGGKRRKDAQTYCTRGAPPDVLPRLVAVNTSVSDPSCLLPISNEQEDHMSAIYFKAAMSLVNVSNMHAGTCGVPGGSAWHHYHWTRRSQIMTFCANRLYRKLGQY